MAAFVWAPSAAEAALSSGVSDGVLTVTGGRTSDVVVIGCTESGNVEVNGADPGTGPVACAELTAIDVSTGGGNDSVLLDEMRPVDFPNLASTRVDGGGGSDWFLDSCGDETLVGGPGADTFQISCGGHDALRGGGGDDLLKVETRGDVTLTDATLATARGKGPISSIASAQIRGSGRGVRIDAGRFGGPTLINTYTGADVLIGGGGNDLMSSGRGDDRLIGGPGDDHIYGDAGDDVLRGGAGSDRLDGGPGRDDCSGGPGDDAALNCP